MLPLEAIELDVFRRRHDGDTFWCGLLLGGCGLQLTTKLYTDRVCHFAHRRGPEGHLHMCGRRARGVSSADHLYVKSAAGAWPRERGTPGGFEFTQPDGTDRLRGGQPGRAQGTAGAPGPGCGAGVGRRARAGAGRVRFGGPGHVIRRWYVHPIRLDSEGTARVVRIGTEAFARPTERFGFAECEVTERGLTTPAVQRIVAPAPPHACHLCTRFLHISHALNLVRGDMVDRLASLMPVHPLWGGFPMRTRTAAASAVVVLLTLLGSTACSASSDHTPSTHSSEGTKKGVNQQQAAQSKPVVEPSKCAVPTDKMPEECEVHASFAATHMAVPAEGEPTPVPSN